MAVDRFIRWPEAFPKDLGPPTVDRLAAIARDYLGQNWHVEIEEGGRPSQRCWIRCSSTDRQTFPLLSEIPGKDSYAKEIAKHYRGFTVFFSLKEKKGKILDPPVIEQTSVITYLIEQTSVITYQADEFTGNVADGYAKLVARWWDAKVEWPT